MHQIKPSKAGGGGGPRPQHPVPPQRGPPLGPFPVLVAFAAAVAVLSLAGKGNAEILSDAEYSPKGEDAAAGRTLDLSHLFEGRSPRSPSEHKRMQRKNENPSRDTDEAPGEPDEDDEEKEPEEPDDDIDKPLEPAIEKFQKAMERACSPSTVDGLFGNLGGKLSGTVGQVEGWMGSLLGAMTQLESDPTALYNYIKGEGSIWDLLKSNYLFLIAVAAGVLVLVFYLLCCLPKLCCRVLRRMCCCFKCCAGKMKCCSRVIWVVLIALLGLAAAVFACLVIVYQTRGVHGAQQLYCQTYLFAEETLRGSQSLVGKTRKAEEEQDGGNFGGLIPLIDGVTTLASLVDGSNPNNVIEQAKTAATEALDVAPMAKEMNLALETLEKSCTSFVATNSLAGGSHKSLWCMGTTDKQGVAADKLQLTKTFDMMKTSAEKIVAFEPKKYVQRIFTNVSLPTLDVAGSFPISTVKDLFFQATDALASTEDTATTILRWLGIGLGIDCGFALGVLLLTLIWAGWFFFRGSKANSCTPALLWNLLTWAVVVFLVFGGVLGWIMTLGRQGCSIVTDDFLEGDKWDILADYAPVVEPLVTQCLTKEGEGDMLAAVGVKEPYDQTLDAIKNTLDAFPDNVVTLDKNTTAKVDVLMDAASSFGALVAADPTQAPSTRQVVFPQYLTSGMQAEDVDLGGGKILYGLATLEGLVSPWKLKVLHPEEPGDGEFVVGDANPNEADPKYKQWLEDLKKQKKEQLIKEGTDASEAETKAEEIKTQTKNGIWWLQQKNKLLNTNYTCKGKQGEDSSCTFQDMFGVNAAEIQNSNLYTRQRGAGQSYLNISSCFQNAVSSAVGELDTQVVQRLEDLRNSLNCRYLRRNVLQVAVVACESAVTSFYYVAMYRTLGGGLACLVIICLFILWRNLKDGNKRDGSAPEAPAAV